MTGKQFAAAISRIFGTEGTSEQAAKALDLSKRTINRYRAKKKVPQVVARALNDIEGQMHQP